MIYNNRSDGKKLKDSPNVETMIDTHECVLDERTIPCCLFKPYA